VGEAQRPRRQDEREQDQIGRLDSLAVAVAAPDLDPVGAQTERLKRLPQPLDALWAVCKEGGEGGSRVRLGARAGGAGRLDRACPRMRDVPADGGDEARELDVVVGLEWSRRPACGHPRERVDERLEDAYRGGGARGWFRSSQEAEARRRSGEVGQATHRRGRRHPSCRSRGRAWLGRPS
jgi:hypothetical protein